MTDVSLAAAFLAGLVSFLSPCVLPLVPGYISMLSGIGMEQLRQGQQPKGGLFLSALSFVVGLHLIGALAKLKPAPGIVIGSVFVVLGVISLVRGDELWAGLGAVHFFSLSVIGFLGPALARWLNRDVHLRSTGKQPGMLSGFLLGFA